MANPCFIEYNGKQYSHPEFMSMLHDGLLDEMVSSKTIDSSSFKQAEPPIEPPKEQQSNIYAERPATELSFRGLQNVANEFGYEDVKSRERISDIQEVQNANNLANEWKESGTYNKKVNNLLNDIEERKTVPTATQRLLLQEHLANEIATLRNIKDKNSTEFDQQLQKVKRIKEVGQIARQEAGAALRIGDTRSQGSPIENYEDAFIAKMEALDVNELTEQQKAEVEAQIENYKQKEEAANVKIKDLEDKLAEMQAEKEFKKQKTSTPRVKKSSEEYQKIRQDIVASIKDKWKKSETDGTLTAVPLPYAKQLAAITPDVVKLAKSYIEEGYDNLSDVISKIKESLPEFSEREIRGMIAGEYNDARPPKTELQNKYEDLSLEGKLLNELEQWEESTPDTESKKRERNVKIKELRDELNKKRKERGDYDKAKLKSLIARNVKEKEQIQSKIDNGDFSEAPKPLSIFDNKELQRKYPELYAEALDAIKAKEDAKAEYDVALLKDQISRETKKEKVIRAGGKIFNTVKAIKTGIDLSGIGIQTLVSTAARPKIGGKAIVESMKQLASPKKFDRWLTELHNSEMYPLMQKSGLSITEPQSLKAEAEEAFSGRYSGTVKYKGKEYKVLDTILSPFERAFTSLGNVSRAAAFTQFAQKYMDMGYTFENNPELFKSLAERLNTQTGRGKLNEKVQAASDLVSKGIWSPRLMASRFNLLGVSDLVGAIPGGKQLGTKGFYSQLSPLERKQALIDTGRALGTIVLVSAALAYSTGGELDVNPDSPTFMNITWKNGKSVNITGGLSGYIRDVVQFGLGKKYKDGKWQDISRMEKVGRVLRGKTPPITGAIINSLEGKNYMGEPTNAWQEAKKVVVPISVEGLVDGFKEGGASDLIKNIPTFIPSAMGFNIRDQKEFDGKDDTLEKLLERNTTTENQELDEIKNYKKGGIPITEEEKKKYIEERDKYIEKRIKDLWEGKDPENKFKENGVTKKVPYSEMSRKEIVQATTNIKTAATREIKEKLFGKKKKSKIKERF